MDDNRCYIAIDLKSFYASVECVLRGLDPLKTHLVVADETRTDKTICLAVSPSLKALGIGGRPRLFEARQAVQAANRLRGTALPGRSSSCDADALAANPSLAIDFIIAPPRMALYIEYSTRIFEIYSHYAAPEDMHVYSVDEVFIDATPYLHAYGGDPHAMAMTMIRHVLRETGVTATAGIGTNMYLCKIAMDIVAKRMTPDADGVRVAALDETAYRRLLWAHTPITDFWRIGSGIARRLADRGMYTMGDVARMSINHEDTLYAMFGVNAELLIDHAWGHEPVSIADIKAYTPSSHSISEGQVLTEPYKSANALTVILEMSQSLALNLVAKGLVTKAIAIDIGYDVSNISDDGSCEGVQIVIDRYGRRAPAPSHASGTFAAPTASAKLICKSVTELWHSCVHNTLTIRRLNITACEVLPVGEVLPAEAPQPDLFGEYIKTIAAEKNRQADEDKAQRIQRAMLDIKTNYGKNAILTGLNYREGATGRQRNRQIGGHKA